MKRIPQLDSVRGLAVLLVLLHNTDAYPSLHLGFIAANGWMGVDLFFVLSGFLITRLLLDAKRSPGYFTRFYARRCLRIWPLYYSALLIMFLAVPFLRPSQHAAIFGARSSPWWSYFVFLQNFLVAVPTRAAGLLAVTWSLAIEEQFYLVWPVVVRVLNEAQLRRTALAVIISSPVLRYYLSLHEVNIYSNTFCRLDGLMAGAFLALTLSLDSFIPSKWVGMAWLSFLVSGSLALELESFHARWIGFSFVVLASVSLIYLALFSERGWLRALLQSRFLIYTGTISYGIYLLAKLPCDAALALGFDKHPLVSLLATTAATYILASLSWRFIEQPFLSLKKLLKTRPEDSSVVRPRAAEIA